MAREKTAEGRRQSVRRSKARATSRRLEESIAEQIIELYEKPVEEWDWEELSHGRPRSVDGKFTGTKPKWITPAIHAEAQRRMRALSEQELMTHARAAIDTLRSLMDEDDVDDFGKPLVAATVRVDCAKYILNHVIGTPKARLEVETGSPLMALMGQILVNPDGDPSHNVIEGSVVNEDEGEDTD